MHSDSPVGRVFDIERCATEDGPGIRTVVFLQGCNMHCPWCHNPEGLSSAPQWMQDADLCVHCGACAKACSNGIHEMVNGHHSINSKPCASCMRCVENCLSGALKRIWKLYSVDELTQIVSLDRTYYQNSGGGVTLSGGEVMLQYDFAVKFLQRMKKEGIAAAIETNLSFPWKMYSELLAYVDLVMADIKIWDANRHKALTGVTNARIISNVDNLTAMNKPMIIRTPVIPGVNDRLDDILSIAQFLQNRPNLLYYELLPYHPLGLEKAHKIGLPVQRYEIPSRKTLTELAETIRPHVNEVRISGVKVERNEQQ